MFDSGQHKQQQTKQKLIVLHLHKKKHWQLCENKKLTQAVEWSGQFEIMITISFLITKLQLDW